MAKIERYIIASDVGDRDGIGIEIYSGNDMLLEVFRDDSKKVREVTLYRENLDLDLIEESIELFKREIPWEFQD
ncbi:hypothetical protein FDY93_19085 [Microbulbifer harenosus]|uniref:DUF4926 domain-containing protein n=1 Tax=Microbulbifer harenosus TaxID=2576840 RepID=A0ABY2UHV1_9GAMM|nr:hypothetical protein FDY93_19085 [Microbulbifer harenosus]